MLPWPIGMHPVRDPRRQLVTAFCHAGGRSTLHTERQSSLGVTVRRLFISYARENRHDVDQLVEHLGLMGYETWVDFKLRGGQDWWEEILRRIADSDVFIAVVSLGAMNSTACRREFDWARGVAPADLARGSRAAAGGATPSASSPADHRLLPRRSTRSGGATDSGRPQRRARRANRSGSIAANADCTPVISDRPDRFDHRAGHHRLRPPTPDLATTRCGASLDRPRRKAWWSGPHRPLRQPPRP